MNPVIPPRSNRKNPRDYDRDLYNRGLYKLRHLVENAFLDLKQWRGVATRYAKKVRLFPGYLPDPNSGYLDYAILTTPPSITTTVYMVG